MTEDLQTTTNTIIEIITTYGIDVLAAIAILIVGWWVAGWAKNLTAKALSRIKNSDSTLTGFLSSLVRYAIIAVTVMAVLDRFGVETTSLIAVFGAAGLAIGLALQGTLSNVAAGVMLLIFRPMKVGDFVDAGGLTGTVKHLGLFTTDMTTPDNVLIIVPNSEIWGKAISNFSTNKKRRLDLLVGIGYEDSIDTAFKAIQKTVTKDKRVLKDPETVVFVDNLGGSSVDINVRFWVKSSDYWQTKWDLTKAIKESLDTAGVNIPYPQRTVHIVNDESSATIANTPAKKTGKTKAA
jgi:small conductance mechanosensitive channel